MTQNKKPYPQWLFMSAVLLISLIEVLFLLHLHHKNLAGYSGMARGVVLGTPPWRAYQNRLLGPWMVWGATQAFGHSYEAWFLVLTGLLWAGANLALYWLAGRMTGNQLLAVGAVLVSVLMTLVLEGPQGAILYLWDPIDVLLFTALAYGLFTKKGLGFFLLLFFVELFNREAAIFIALWLIIDAFRLIREGGRSRLSLTQPRQLVVGLVLVMIGIAWTKFIRDTLFKYSSEAGVAQDTKHMEMGNHWMLLNNMRSFEHLFHHPAPIDLVSFMICPALIAFLWWHRRDYNELFVKVLLLLVLMTLSVLLFAVSTELRTWLDLAPLLIMLHLAMGRQRRRRAAMSATV